MMNHSKNMIMSDDSDNQVQMEPIKMAEWLIQNKVIEILFGEGAHIEIVKRSDTILKFLAKQASDSLTIDTVAMIWKCQQGKHEEMVRSVYLVIEKLIPYINIDLINGFFTKIQEHQQIDEKFLIFLKNFSNKALEKAYGCQCQIYQDAQIAEQEKRRQ